MKILNLLKSLFSLCIVILFFQLNIANLNAQNHNAEVWGGYINSIALNNRWKIWDDYQFVPKAFGIIRPGITYQTKSGYQFTVGYAYVRTSTPISESLIRKENRIWGQIIKNYQINSKMKYICRFRYDARFRQSLNNLGETVENDYIFYNRFRLMQDFRYALTNNSKTNYWHIDFINETLFNTGQHISDGIDQVRSYLMMGYTHPKFTVLGGYHQRFVPSKTNPWVMNHGFTMWFIHSVSFKKDENN